MCYLYEKDLIRLGKHGDELEYKLENAKLKWEISVSSNGEIWKEVFPKDNTVNFTKNGSLYFTGLEGWVCSSIEAWSSQDNKDKFYWLRCILLESEYEYPPRIEKISLNTAPVIQKKKIMESRLGESNGLPGQLFKLPEAPALRGSVILTLEGEKWNEVEDFDGSGPDSTHFTLESFKGEIRFGDGLMGKVPKEGTEIQVIEYETVRGEQGNLPADSVWTAEGDIFKGLEIKNPKPATGGRGEESIAEAFERFNKDLRVPYRTVTSEDFEYVARETPGLRVAQAKAIPNFDPYSQVEREGSVTVVIIPFSPLDTFKDPPKPSRGFRRAVARHLEEHRLLGTRVYVVSPEYVRVEVTVSLCISKGFSEEKIREVVIDKLKHFLHPTKGGIFGKGWPVGNPVYRSELYKLIMEAQGVEFVEKINIYAQKGADQYENGDLKLTSKVATVYSGKHTVEIFEKAR
jgi:predicted phage baseplate assembly protein